uniref:Interleukin-2 receptor subunit alpha n=1 Tax=Loxodonta africana TaxID=9785 RepID=G3U929_LOXAF
AEFCYDGPPEIRYATFKAHTYKNGTILNCECKKGFRRIRNGSPYILCTGNSSHVSWENKCQCMSNSPWYTEKQVTSKPEQEEERKSSEMQSQMQLLDQVKLLGHCREPPPWEHEAMERKYHFVVGQTVQYQCIKGYRAQRRGRAESTCRVICGETRWTQPRLTCTNEVIPGSYFHKHGLLSSPGKEEAESSTDTLPESEASCPSITTVSQKYTEAVTTTETFIFTTEYQIAVASCVFLLISILLLSVFTWQRKCLAQPQRKERKNL